MIRRHVWKALFVILTSVFGGGAIAQEKTAPGNAPRAIIFAVVNDGTWIEPIARIENGKIVESAAESDTGKSSPFSDRYYKPNSKYQLIFGGMPSGTVTVKSPNIGSDCGGASAEVTVKSTKVELKGLIMALATDVGPKSIRAAFRRPPTFGEKAGIETLVRAEYAKHKVPAARAKQLHFDNLTALDVDNDGTAELVGSYWVIPRQGQRDHLFFIAERKGSGKYSFTFSEYERYTPEKVMSGDLKDLTDGIYQTLLLDVFDYDGDGTAEIFTIGKAFEGNNYFVFKRAGGKWKKVFDTYDYHCGY